VQNIVDLRSTGFCTYLTHPPVRFVSKLSKLGPHRYGLRPTGWGVLKSARGVKNAILTHQRDPYSLTLEDLQFVVTPLNLHALLVVE
jgi:hypothetical protein